MKRKKRFYLLIILISSGFWMNLNSQSPPNFDDNWVLNSQKSDEFNTLNLSKWERLYCLVGNCYGQGAMHYSHAFVESGILKLKIDKINNVLWEGGVRSSNFEYTYGYYEIYAKHPGYYNNGQSCNQGLGPCFWTFNTDPGIHREIDIMETVGNVHVNAKSFSSGWHTNQLTGAEELGYGGYQFNSLTPLFADYHKYGVEWLPNRIVYYFDDKPYFCSWNDISVPNQAVEHPHKIIIDLQLNGSINSNTPLPLYMEVDYFRYYELKKDCSKDETILNNSQLNSFDFQVKRNISIGNGRSIISLSSGDNLTFRATNDITINGVFTVPLGSELNLIPTPCN